MILKHLQDFPSFQTCFNSSITCYTNQGFPNFYKVCRIYSHFIYRDFSSVTCVYWGFIVSHQKEKKYKNNGYRAVALWPLLLSVSLTAAFPTNTFILLSENKKKNYQNIKVMLVQISTVGQIKEINRHIWNIVFLFLFCLFTKKFIAHKENSLHKVKYLKMVKISAHHWHQTETLKLLFAFPSVEVSLVFSALILILPITDLDNNNNLKKRNFFVTLLFWTWNLICSGFLLLSCRVLHALRKVVDAWRLRNKSHSFKIKVSPVPLHEARAAHARVYSSHLQEQICF